MSLRIKDHGAGSVFAAEEGDLVAQIQEAAKRGQVRTTAGYMAQLIPVLVEEIESLRSELDDLKSQVSQQPEAQSAAPKVAAKKASSRKTTKKAAQTTEVEDVAETDEVEEG